MKKITILIGLFFVFLLIGGFAIAYTTNVQGSFDLNLDSEQMEILNKELATTGLTLEEWVNQEVEYKISEDYGSFEDLFNDEYVRLQSLCTKNVSYCEQGYYALKTIK